METLPHCNSNGDTVPTGAHCKKKKSNKTKVKQKPNPPQAASYTTFILLFKENRHDEHFPNSKLAALVNTWPSVPSTVIFCDVKQFLSNFGVGEFSVFIRVQRDRRAWNSDMEQRNVGKCSELHSCYLIHLHRET